MHDISIIATAKVNPSEDVKKIVHAVKNVINNPDIKIDDDNVIATSEGKQGLMFIREQCMRREVLGVLKRILLENLVDDHTWFYVNKQAAYAGIIAICEDERESPLGPIKVEIKAKDIDGLIEWLTRF